MPTVGASKHTVDEPIPAGQQAREQHHQKLLHVHLTVHSIQAPEERKMRSFSKKNNLDMIMKYIKITCTTTVHLGSSRRFLVWMAKGDSEKMGSA
jgi:surfactin synthase thioesterase subunit